MTRSGSIVLRALATAAVAVDLDPVEADDETLRAQVYAEYPALDPDHPHHYMLTEWERVSMLRDFSYRHTTYTNSVGSDAYRVGAGVVNEMLAGGLTLSQVFEFFDADEGGVACGHTAHVLQRLLTEFGYEAWYLGYGFMPSSPREPGFTHAETLVRIPVDVGGERRRILTLHDPSTNVGYTGADGVTPLDYFELLRLLVLRRADEIRMRVPGDPWVDRGHPSTISLADETAGREPTDFAASWNVGDPFEWFDLGEGVWKFVAPRRRETFEKVLENRWRKELERVGLPNQPIYLHLFPIAVAGGPDSGLILERARATIEGRDAVALGWNDRRQGALAHRSRPRE